MTCAKIFSGWNHWSIWVLAPLVSAEQALSSVTLNASSWNPHESSYRWSRLDNKLSHLQSYLLIFSFLHSLLLPSVIFDDTCRLEDIVAISKLAGFVECRCKMRHAGQSREGWPGRDIPLLLEVNDKFVMKKSYMCAVKTNHLWIYALNVTNQMPLSFSCVQVWGHSSRFMGGDKKSCLEEESCHLLPVGAHPFWKKQNKTDCCHKEILSFHGLSVWADGGGRWHHQDVWTTTGSPLSSPISSQPLTSIPSVHSHHICRVETKLLRRSSF